MEEEYFIDPSVFVCLQLCSGQMSLGALAVMLVQPAHLIFYLLI